MRLATVLTPAGPRAAVLQGGHYVDLHATDPRLPAGVRQLLEGGPDALREAAAAAQRPTWPATPPATTCRPATGSWRRTASSGWPARRSTPSPRPGPTW